MDQTVLARPLKAELVEQACTRLRKLLSEWPMYHGDFQRWIWQREQQVKTAALLKDQGREPMFKTPKHASTRRPKD